MNNRFDLNLLRYIFVIKEYGNVATIVRRLGISRSTLNRSLGQMRAYFDNEVFVLSGGEYRATAFTEQLLKQLSGPLAQVDDCLSMSSCESLDSIGGNLRLYSPAYVGDLFAVDVLKGLQTYNPNMGLSIFPWPVDQLPELNATDLSIGINRFPISVDGNFIQRRLLGADVGVYFRADHPLAHEQVIELEQLEREVIVTLETGAQVDSFDGVWLANSGVAFSSRVVMSTMSSAMRCAAAFNYFVVAADFYEGHTHNLVWRPIRVEGEPVAFECGLAYHRSWYQHPAMRQVELLLQQVVRDIQYRNTYACHLP